MLLLLITLTWSLFSALKQTHCPLVTCDSKCLTVTFYSAFWNIHWSGVLTALFGCYMAGSMWNCCHLSATQTDRHLLQVGCACCTTARCGCSETLSLTQQKGHLPSFLRQVCPLPLWPLPSPGSGRSAPSPWAQVGCHSAPPPTPSSGFPLPVATPGFITVVSLRCGFVC